MLINPFQSWLGLLSGQFWGQWERFYSDLAAGALFGYSSLIAVEILIRTQLFSTKLQEARPKSVGGLKLVSMVMGICGIGLAILLWTTNQSFHETHQSAYWLGLGCCLIALGMLLFAVWLETASKKVTDEYFEGAQE